MPRPVRSALRRQPSSPLSAFGSSPTPNRAVLARVSGRGSVSRVCRLFFGPFIQPNLSSVSVAHFPISGRAAHEVSETGSLEAETGSLAATSDAERSLCVGLTSDSTNRGWERRTPLIGYDRALPSIERSDVNLKIPACGTATAAAVSKVENCATTATIRCRCASRVRCATCSDLTSDISDIQAGPAMLRL